MGKQSAPPPPDYSPFISASQQTAASDTRAAEMQYDLGLKQLDAQQRYADQSAQRGDQYYQMSKDSQDWARQQFDLIWPYASEYMSSQQALSNLAGENASEAVIAAREQRRQATETYDRYMTSFAPMESEFARQAQDYNTPARADQASAAAQADVATAFDQQTAAREAQLKSYGIDPSQARYQGESAMSGLQKAAAQASAGTQARRAQELTGFGLQQQAIAIGQKLPTIALGQIEAATGSATGGLQAGQVGGGGITAANSVYGTGATAGGSPVGFGYLSNPYTSLSGSAASLGGSLYGAGNQAMANSGSALGIGMNALNNSFSNQLQGAQFESKQQEMLWGGLGKLAGGLGQAYLLSDRRLKDDIRVIGRVGALPLHSYRYRDDPSGDRYIGYMADEVARLDPAAVVSVRGGYQAVDYNRATMSALEG